MQVAQYTFQSPSSSPVQVGKLDPSSLKGESSSTKIMDVPNETAGKVATHNASVQSEVTPTISNERLLDIYA